MGVGKDDVGRAPGQQPLAINNPNGVRRIEERARRLKLCMLLSLIVFRIEVENIPASNIQSVSKLAASVSNLVNKQVEKYSNILKRVAQALMGEYL